MLDKTDTTTLVLKRVFDTQKLCNRVANFSLPLASSALGWEWQNTTAGEGKTYQDTPMQGTEVFIQAL